MLVPSRQLRLAQEDISEEILRIAQKDQSGIPSIAKNPIYMRHIEYVLRTLPTRHTLILGDSRSMDRIPDETVHLAITSPPYWNLKVYPKHQDQLGAINDYEAFLIELDKVWREVFRVLVPGGRLVVVVGDVCLPRRLFGRHVVFPLHASIQEHCRLIGFDNLAPIIWHKIANAKFEAPRGTNFLGKPYEPSGVIKNDLEYILFQRKPGGYRKPDLRARVLSIISETNHKEWFNQIWNLTGASTRKHPAPYPVKLAERLVRMFSFAEDTVLDPFMGTGSTNVAAGRWGRNSIGIEIEPAYFQLSKEHILQNSEYGEIKCIIPEEKKCSR